MGSGKHRNRQPGGFTLLELVIVVAIVTILAAIAYPSYQEYLKKGRRAAAQSYLMDLAQRQQQYLLDARAYAPDAATLSAPTPTEVAPYYNLVITADALNNATCAIDGAAPTPKFTITATAIGVQVSDGDLKIDNRGTKCPSTKW